MTNILLQHWTGEVNELGIASSANISKYAAKCGVEYKLLRGDVFRPNLSPPCQKLHMLEDAFDDYDTVIMVDMDMFTRAGMEENIFDESIQGIGMSTDGQEHLFQAVRRRHPQMTNPNYTYWGGAVWKLNRELRQELRSYITDPILKAYSDTYVDEGIMHWLGALANVPKQKLPGVRHWCHNSFSDGVEHSALIHIRTKITPQGPKRDKIENYRDLVQRGLIEE